MAPNTERLPCSSVVMVEPSANVSMVFFMGLRYQRHLLGQAVKDRTPVANDVIAEGLAVNAPDFVVAIVGCHLPKVGGETIMALIVWLFATESD